MTWELVEIVVRPTTLRDGTAALFSLVLWRVTWVE